MIFSRKRFRFSKQQPNKIVKRLKQSWHLLYATFLILHFKICYSHNIHDYGIPLGYYSNLWICNVSILLSVGGILFHYPTIVASSIIAVSSSHLAWICDSILMFFTGELSGPFQIADYTTLRKNELWYRIWVNSHHLWFIPLNMLYLKGRSEKFRITLKHYFGGAIWVWLISGITILLIPNQCMETIFDDGKSRCLFININMIRKWWGSDNIDVLHWFDRSNGVSAWIYFVYANFIYSGVMNGFYYFFLKKYMMGQK